jgi:PLP dependent protein
MDIKERLHRVLETIGSACRRVGRSPDEIQLVAVSKRIDVDRMREGIEAGIRIIGENRINEAYKKYKQLGNRVEWHFVGHLQTNKVKRCLQFADLIESVDSVRLAQEISRRAGAMNRSIDVFAEVNTSGEMSKFGLLPEKVVDDVVEMARLPNIQVTGLMTVAAFVEDAEQVRPSFRLLRELRDRINRRHVDGLVIKYLSMGMSNDYPVAVEEGATHVRIGQAIFGPRE